MPILITCSTCGTKLRARDHAAGKRCKCSKCGTSLVVPAAAGSQAAAPPPQPASADANTGAWPAPPELTNYPRMRRSLTLLRARRKVRTILDASGFGPSALGRLCLALILCAVLFGVSLMLSVAIHQPPVYAVAQSTAIFVATFVPFLVLVLGPSDEELAKRLDYIIANLSKTKTAWREHKNQLAAERFRQKQNRAEPEEEEEQEEDEQSQKGRCKPALRCPEEAPRPPPLLIVTPTKSMGISIILSILFGPLGKLYSTVAGGLIMMVISFIAVPCTAGLGLLLTWPICVIWGAMATSSCNQKILRGQRQY